MVTNDDRREVARRLRGLEVCELDGEFIDCGEVESVLGLVSDDGAWYEAEGVMRLADLIEPSEGQDETDVSVDRGLGTEGGRSPDTGGQRPKSCPKMSGVSGIDCDALLELADEFERAACYRQMRGELCAPIGVRVIREYACRIREALGDDNAR